ncbi:MAG: 30S ribosomal protein S16 [Patescibacteria group bacterium]|nr:30S ribosomal protein S16 [Patescibacteria group bacterium]MCL5224239.1 30S ribosomal protein S16 [Patescibacteria group bacterium]
MLSIRLKNVGKKHQRSFRVIVQESHSKLQGKFLEDLGWWNPHTDKADVKNDRAKYWIEKGAQPSQTVRQLLDKQGKVTTS